jgi:hypothetical protein
MITDTAAELPVVDLDAGQTFGTDELRLMRPFRLGGRLYDVLPVVVPNGAQARAFVDPVAGRTDGKGLMCSLAGITPEALDAMYAGDRGTLDLKIGAHISVPRPGRPIVGGEPVDQDAKEGFGREVVALSRPIKFKGTVYREIPVRVPTGLDVSRFVDTLPVRNAVSTDLMVNLTELSADLFDALYARDRAAVEAAVGKHL